MRAAPPFAVDSAAAPDSGRAAALAAQSCPARPGQPPSRGRQCPAPRRSSQRGPRARSPSRPRRIPARPRAPSPSSPRGRGPRRLPAPAPRPRCPGPCGLGPAGARRAPEEMRLRNGTFLTLLLFCLCAFLSLSWYAALSGQKGEPPPSPRCRPAVAPRPPHTWAHLGGGGRAGSGCGPQEAAGSRRGHPFPGWAAREDVPPLLAPTCLLLESRNSPPAWAGPRARSPATAPCGAWGLASAGQLSPMPGAVAPTSKLKTYGVLTEGHRHKVTEVAVTKCPKEPASGI